MSLPDSRPRALDNPLETRDIPRRPVNNRQRLDRAFVVFCLAVASVSVVVLAVLLISIVYKGIGYVNWGFLTSIPDPVNPEKAGIFPAMGGTLWVCAVCGLMTLPIGVATAIFLEEFKPRNRVLRWIHGLIQLNITNLAGVPSVVYGIIGVTAFVAMFGLFGHENDPALEVGAGWYDQFGVADSDNNRTVRFAVDGPSAEKVQIADSLEGYDGRWRQRAVKLIGPWAPVSDDNESVSIRTASLPTRVEVDGQHYDQFESLAGSWLRVKVEPNAPPTPIKRGMTALKEGDPESDDLPFVKVLDSEGLPKVKMKVGAEPKRVADGGEFFDEFQTRDDFTVRVPVDSGDSPPTELVEDESVFGQTKSGAQVELIGATSGLSSAFKARFDEMLRAGPQPGRISENAWYRFRLPLGRSVLAGALTLMLVILPIVIIASQEAFRAVPDSLREGALGLGATPWNVVRNVTLPAAIPGIMTGSILAMSRAIGEAAPILIICGIVFISYMPSSLMDDFTVAPLQIYNWAKQPQAGFQHTAAAGIIVLLSILLVFNGLAVFLRQKFHKPLS